jgi:hypothetical protein
MEDLAYGLLGFRALDRDLATVRRETSSTALEGKKEIGFLERNLMFTTFVKQLHPALRNFIDNVSRQQANQKQRGQVLRQAYSYNLATGEFDPTIAKSNYRVATTDGLAKAASSIKRYANEMEQAGKTWTMTDKVVTDALNRLNVKDRDAVKTEIDSARARHRVWTEVVLPEAMTSLSKEQTAKVFAVREVGMKPDVARALSDRMYAAVATMQDPLQAILGTDMLKKILSEVSPETFQAALKHAQGMIQDVNAHIEFMRSRPSYTSETRFDKNHLVMRGPDGQEFRASAASKDELQKIRTTQEAKGYTFTEFIEKSRDNTPTGIRQDVLDKLVELDKQSYNRLEQALSDAPSDVKAAALSETQRAEQYRTAIEAFKPTPGVSRRFVEGREYINMLQNDEQFYARANNWLMHRLTRAGAAVDSLDAELAGNKELSSYAQQHVDQFLKPDSPIASKLAEVTYFTRLGFSFGNSLLESMQNLTTGMQALIAETGSVGDAYKYWGKAVKGIVSHGVGKGWGSPELEEFLNLAKQRGQVETTSYNDVIDPDTEKVYSMGAAGQSVPGKALNVVSKAARNWSRFFQKYNNDIALIAGFHMGTERGLTGEELFQFAKDIKDRGTYTGGKAQRPVGLWNIETRAVPQIMSALQTYTLGWFSQMATHYKIGFTGASDATPIQREGARKAFVYGLAAQAVLAGALGLPGMSQGMALVKQASGFDTKGWLRAHLATFFKEDEDAGGWLTGLALHGGLSAVLPVDPSNRAALSFPFTGIDPYKGFDISQLLGAPGSTVSDMVKGTIASASGDFTGFQSLMPTFLKPAATLYQGEGDIRDKRGALIYKLSTGEKIATLMGLPPTRVQTARDVSEAVRNLDDQAKKSREADVDRLAAVYRTKGAQAGQTEVLRYLKDNPGTPAAELVRSIASRVEAQTLPVDYRRDVNVGADLAGLGNRTPSTELYREQFRSGVENSLGIEESAESYVDASGGDGG